VKSLPPVKSDPAGGGWALGDPPGRVGSNPAYYTPLIIWRLKFARRERVPGGCRKAVPLEDARRPARRVRTWLDPAALYTADYLEVPSRVLGKVAPAGGLDLFP
jgi:hypothetical protein